MEVSPQQAVAIYTAIEFTLDTAAIRNQLDDVTIKDLQIVKELMDANVTIID